MSFVKVSETQILYITMMKMVSHMCRFWKASARTVH